MDKIPLYEMEDGVRPPWIPSLKTIFEQSEREIKIKSYYKERTLSIFERCQIAVETIDEDERNCLITLCLNPGGSWKFSKWEEAYMFFAILIPFMGNNLINSVIQKTESEKGGQ